MIGMTARAWILTASSTVGFSDTGAPSFDGNATHVFVFPEGTTTEVSPIPLLR